MRGIVVEASGVPMPTAAWEERLEWICPLCTKDIKVKAVCTCDQKWGHILQYKRVESYIVC